MPSLLESLQKQDLGMLNIIAEFWGLDFHAPDVRKGRDILAELMLNKNLATELFESLSTEEKEAIQLLVENDLRYSWKQFKEIFGDFRDVGSAKRDREQTFLNPISTTEKLFYQGWIHTAFFDIENNPKEMVYLPDDFVELIPIKKSQSNEMIARPAKPDERKVVNLSNENLIDDVCTLLAKLRMNPNDEELELVSEFLSTDLTYLREFLISIGFLDKDNQVDTTLVRKHLESSRLDEFRQIAKSWIESKTFNDLLFVPELVFEGEWENHPLISRQTVINRLKNSQPDTWWNIQTFISSFKKDEPEFLRQSNDYDNWYIRLEKHEEYLQGFENWNQIEGRYLNYLITGPLHWFGIVDLGSRDKNVETLSFRLSQFSKHLFDEQENIQETEESDQVFITDKLILDIPKTCKRTIRYHLSRFCELDRIVRENFRYRITVESLQKARDFGLEVDQLIKLLQKHSAGRLSKNVIQAIKRWEEKGVEATISPHLILRVHDPEILKELKASKASRFLGDSLSSTSVIVNPGAWEKVQEALGEIGLLTNITENKKE